MSNKPTPVFIPLLNPNEPEAILVSVNISEGQHISRGQALCTLETTKSVADVIAERDGFVVGLSFSVGHTVRAGETLCYLANSPSAYDSANNLPEESISLNQKDFKLPKNLRITQPAIDYAVEEMLDLKQLPIGPLITKSFLKNYIEKTMNKNEFPLIQSEFDPSALIIFGGGGHGKMLIDLVRSLKVYNIIGIVDDGLQQGDEVMGLPVLGSTDVLPEMASKGVKLALNAVGGIGDISIRIEVFKKLAENGFVCPPVVHPSAIVETSSILSPGVQILANAYIGSQAEIRFGVIVNTGAIISHDCILDDYSIITPGAVIAGEVQVGKGSLVGMAATVNIRTKIGDKARIGNGATVKADVPASAVVKAGSIWPVT
ncbi:MAG: NeuD/PglB/VioB family sugar acetyltransferase [Anaerolineales bacterium]